MISDIDVVDTLVSHGYTVEQVSDTSEKLTAYVPVHEGSKPIAVDYYPLTGHLTATYYYRLTDSLKGLYRYYNLDVQKLLDKLAFLVKWLPIASTINKEHAAAPLVGGNTIGRLLAFGGLLKDVLIAEGYEAVVAPGMCKYAGLLVPELLIATGSIPRHISIQYHRLQDDGSPYYTVGADYEADGRANSYWEDIQGLVSLLERLPYMMARVRTMECNTCHYGSDRGLHCGMGLVGTGECSHYMGCALH